MTAVGPPDWATRRFPINGFIRRRKVSKPPLPNVKDKGIALNPWLRPSNGLSDSNYGLRMEAMSSKPPQARSDRRTNAPDGQKPSIVLPAVIVGLLIVGVAVAYKMFEGPPPAAAPAATPVATVAPTQKPPAVQAIAPSEEVTETPAAPVPVASGLAATAPPARVPPSEPAADSRQLMAALTALDLKGPITAEDAQKWKESLQQLIHQGPSSVTAILEYLAQNQDVNYAGVTGADQLGFSSLRAGLLDALGQIGGPESTAAMLQTLQTTVFPTDVAALAATLEQQAPGQYSDEVLAAVRAQLALAAQDQLGNANVGPLFQLLSSAAANGIDVTADLAQYSGKWPYYAAIELASLPNGAGVPSLIQMAQNNEGGNQTAAAQALAQLAPQNSQARSALLDMASQGQLSDAALAQLAPYLGGRENQLGSATNPSGTSTQDLHLANGNQDFSVADLLNSLTPDQVTQRLSIVDQLLQTIPASDTLGQQALQQQKNALTGRQAK